MNNGMSRKGLLVAFVIIVLILAYYALRSLDKKTQPELNIGDNEQVQPIEQNENLNVDLGQQPVLDGLPNSYASDALDFSLRFPKDYTVKSDYKYQALGPGKEISGVAFIIPAALASGTNLSADSYLSVEKIPGANNCRADLFLDIASSGQAATTTVKGGIAYSFASSTGAGAGNRYEESVFARPGTNSCLAIRYYIHYSVLENYPEGTISAFDREKINQQFEAMLLSVGGI